MPFGSKAPEPMSSLTAGMPNRITARTPEPGQLGDLLAEALAGVLHDARQRHDLARLVDALAHEQRGDQVGHRDVALGDEIAQRR